MSESTEQQQQQQHSEPRFPAHGMPRVWFIARASSPIHLSLCKHALEHGDSVVAGINPADAHDFHNVTETMETLLQDAGYDGDTSSLKAVALDIRIMSQCQAAIAEAISQFGRIDVLCCASPECVVGTVEELGQDSRTYALVQDQFEANLFGPVNLIKAALPFLRARRNGHIILLSVVAGHLGTPGLSVYCASQWAIEGYCDSLAYEVAPFNIKVTIVQPQLEVIVFTNRITSAPPMQAYEEESNSAPLARNILSSLLDKIEGTEEPTTGDQLHSSAVTSLQPALAPSMQDQMVGETVSAILAIAGHQNPPARHIVGADGVQAVKEKLKTVSEELEDFAECSCQADVYFHDQNPDG